MSPFIRDLPSSHEEDPGLEPGSKVFIDGNPEVGLALRLLQGAERAHLGSVFGAGPEFSRALPIDSWQ